MTHTWTPDQIRSLRKAAFSRMEDAYVEEQVSQLNRHLNKSETATSVSMKLQEWKEVERIATELNDVLLSLQEGAESQSHAA